MTETGNSRSQRDVPSRSGFYWLLEHWGLAAVIHTPVWLGWQYIVGEPGWIGVAVSLSWFLASLWLSRQIRSRIRGMDPGELEDYQRATMDQQSVDRAQSSVNSKVESLARTLDTYEDELEPTMEHYRKNWKISIRHRDVEDQ